MPAFEDHESSDPTADLVASALRRVPEAPEALTAEVVDLEPADIRLAEVARWLRALVEPEELGLAVLCVTDARGRVTDVHGGRGRRAAEAAGLHRGADLGTGESGGSAVTLAMTTGAPLAQVRHPGDSRSLLAGWTGIAGPVRLATGRPLAFVALYEQADRPTLTRAWLATSLRVVEERARLRCRS